MIRGEEPKNKTAWKKHNGRIVEFFYSSEIRMSEIYFWLPCFSKDLEDIREELGLRRKPKVDFHLTLGNVKNLEKLSKTINLPFRVFSWERPEIVDILWRKPKEKAG